jgi:hypothetical protein
VGEPPFRSRRTFQGDDFYENIIWGDEYKPMGKLEPLPKGDAKLAVKFKYDEKPAAGIGFTLALNGKYRSDIITSNADGIAEISLPFGQWHLNRLECRKWPQQPQGDFILVTGGEEKLGTIPFNQMFMSWDQDGKTIALNKDIKPAHSLTIEIRKRIKLLWPLPNERKQNATIKDSVIKWEPYPKATSYVLKISKVTREEPRTTTFSPLIYKQIDGQNSLSLSMLPHVESDIGSKEYSVDIRAYGQDGSFLSESEHSFSTLFLTDNNVLVEIDDSEGNTLEQADVESRFVADKTLDAVALLIEKEMYIDADKLLNGTDVSILPGRTAMLKGYLNAVQGRCDAANTFFEKALNYGETCIPTKYQNDCRMKK